MKALTGLIALFVSVVTFASPLSFDDKSIPGKVVITFDTSTIKRKIDLLFVIDDSGSMSSHQRKFEQHLRHLMVDLMGMDLQAAVISSSMQMNGYPTRGPHSGQMTGGILTNSDPDFATKLEQNLIVGMDGNATETMFDTTLAALTPPLSEGMNKGFLRSDAELVIVYLTDTDDQSTVSVPQFMSKLDELKGSEKKIKVIGVYIPKSELSTCYGENLDPRRLELVMSYYLGYRVSLCEQDLASRFTEISRSLLSIYYVGPVNIPFPLEPDQKTIVVTHGESVIPVGGWFYSFQRKQVQISSRYNLSSQPFGTPIRVEYTPKSWQ